MHERTPWRRLMTGIWEKSDSDIQSKYEPNFSCRVYWAHFFPCPPSHCNIYAADLLGTRYHYHVT